eukprot:gene5079-5581_t
MSLMDSVIQGLREGAGFPQIPSSNRDFPSTPSERLDQILYQLAVADHVRSMQTIYRDTFDDHSIALELRGSDITKEDKLPTKDLLQRLVEGRSRALALIKLCYGPHSIALIRGYLDLANAYALQGIWVQAEERVLIAMEELVEVEKIMTENTSSHLELRRNGLEAAKRIFSVFHCLRQHVIQSGGEVTISLLKDLVHDFADILTTSSPSTDVDPLKMMMAMMDHHQNEKNGGVNNSHNGNNNNNGGGGSGSGSGGGALPHPSKLFASLAEFLKTSSSKVPLKQLTKSYFPDQNSIYRPHPIKTEEIKTWSETVDFLRNKCDCMKAWIQCVNLALLPQTKALLTIPFRMCDPSGRGLAHPIQVANTLPIFPSVVKVTSGSGFAKALVQANAEVALKIRNNDSAGRGVAVPRLDHQLFGNDGSQGYYYQLPISYEEYLATFLLECGTISLQNQFSLFKVQVLTLKGQCSLHMNNVSLAEEILLKALQELENVGLEMEMVGCELYNSIAQMMITKYQLWMNGRKGRFQKEAEIWTTDTPEGQKAVRVQLKSLKKQYNYTSHPVSTAELEYQAKELTINKRVKELNEKQEADDAMRQSLEAAYRYLVKSYEIFESTHGPVHPVVGTACLAVASAQNLLKDYENTREWLLRAIRIFEKCSPVPVRAITFSQTQLANTLTKLGHEDEARRVLNKAAQFHLSQAKAMLAAHLAQKPGYDGLQADRPNSALNNEAALLDAKPETARSNTSTVSNRSFRQPSARGNQQGSALYDEIQTSVTLLNQVVKMSIHVGEKWEASLLCEEIATLQEEAFGWDSVQAAEATRQVGIRCMDIEDWPRAVRFLTASAQAHEVLFSKVDARYINTVKLLDEAKERRALGTKGLLGEEEQQQIEQLAAETKQPILELNGAMVDSSKGSSTTSLESSKMQLGLSRVPFETPSKTPQTTTPGKERGENDYDDYGDGDFYQQSPMN